MGKVQSDTFQKVSLHGRGATASPAWDPIEAKVTSYGPQEGGKSPSVIVKQGTDPNPTCVNPQCPRLKNCLRHIFNRKDNGLTPSIAIITFRDCTWFDPKKKKKKNKKNGAY